MGRKSNHPADPLFESMPQEIKDLHKKHKEAKREHSRREWKRQLQLKEQFP